MVTYLPNNVTKTIAFDLILVIVSERVFKTLYFTKNMSSSASKVPPSWAFIGESKQI